MISRRLFRFGLVIAAGSAALCAGAAPAQLREDPGAALGRHMKALGQDPRSVSALVGAGNAALQLGDPSAAATFFARAEEVSPRDARVKAGLGSALVALEQPHGALKFFNDAVALGLPETDMAKDRGLAFDMIGDSRRAQRDYQLALRRGEDDEVRRRLALSLAISGDKDAALAAIDSQVRRQERAAWRTRAFILALSGDTAGATKAAASVMYGQAEALRPFFAGLPALNPAQRALAVHFGHFPADGRAVRMAQNFSNAPPPTALGRSAGSAGIAPRNAAPQPVSTAPRRRPGAEENADAEERIVEKITRPGSRIPFRVTEKAPSRDTAAATAPAPQPSQSRPTQLAAATTRPVGPALVPARTPTPEPGQAVSSSLRPIPQSPLSVGASAEPLRQSQPAPTIATTALAPSTAATGGPAPSRPPKSSAPPPIETAEAAAPGLAGIASLIASLSDAEMPPAKVAKASSSTPTQSTPEAKETVASGAPPRRHWVQLAGVDDKSAVAGEYGRLVGKAPALFRGKSGWTTPLGDANRLLVGPFDSADDAQQFVNALAKVELAGFSWSSPAGQEIEKLPAQ